ncbi:PREDICTED: transport and Golgi organization protein 1 isoform X2 [Wasmannia auropunctata]|uniref:transport and Golgi organization protein 1 isoform X2 n=1 Tax=Wasmannia auropunctata TaxID=64793 RepID=UPI0005F018A8|nr:PREDICTED: transport and Golgi organization protein 1 isoform X2 [Wasmannia auropunctata]
MTKINPSTNVSFLRIATILCAIPVCLAALSDKQLCYDPNCSEPISLARTILAYATNDPEVMSFRANVDVKVFSKGAGKRTDLWGVEINGKRGFAPKTFLKEYKVLKRVLSHEVPVDEFNGEANRVQPEKLEPTEKESGFVDTGEELHALLKDELSLDDNQTPSLKSLDESTTEEIHAINADSATPSYEVIDGTTVYFESGPSVQPSFVAEVAHATALPNEPASVISDSDTAHKGLSSDRDTFVSNKESQPGTNDASKLGGIELSVDTQKQASPSLLENLEAISGSLDTVSKDDTLALDGSSESNEESLKDVEHKEKSDSNVEENVEDNEEKVTEQVQSDSIFASITKTFQILSSSVAADPESTITQSSDDVAVPEAAVEGSLQLEEQVSENVEAKDAATEEILSARIKSESSIDQGFVDKEKVEMQQEVMYESIESAEISDEKINEASAIILENTASSDVPSINNFVHENADKPAKELPTAPPILADDSSASAKADVDSHVEDTEKPFVQVQETSEPEIIIENRTDGAVTSGEEESTILSNLQETKITTQNSDDSEQKSPESNEAQLENTKKDADYKEIVDQADKVTAEISETVSSPSDTAENIATESFPESHSVDETLAITEEEALNRSAADIEFNNESIVHSYVNRNDNLVNGTSSDNVPTESNELSNGAKSSVVGQEQSVDSSQESVISEQAMTLHEILRKRDLPSIENLKRKDVEGQTVDSVEEGILPEYGDHINSEDKVSSKNEDGDNGLKKFVSTTDCATENEDFVNGEDNLFDVKLDHNYWKTLMYLCVTALTTLVFTLGYYYIENVRRDGQLIARINKLEKELLVSTKECETLTENLKSIKDKLQGIEDESFGSNEMVISLKADLEVSQCTKIELEEQVSMLEKDLENATEAGLELERMLREVLSNNEVNPLAQSVEDLQARLDAQQTANESLTNALNLKAQEIEALSANLASAKKKCEDFEVKYLQTQDELTTQKSLKNNIEQTLTDKVHSFEEQVDELSTEKSSLYKELRGKEIEVKELLDVISQIKSNNLDLEKLYDVSSIKIEVVQLREERDELKMRLNDVNGAHQLLEEHMKLVKEEIIALSDQCKMAEKERKDAETRLEVLSKFFQDKETERQKEETIWLQKQGEVVSTVERLHTMQNEIQNYKQQVEMLKREIVDQEREYKNQISALEMKAHEQWVAARQNERRLEESKAEASQLRNRLTLVEKNLNDTDPEAKLHRRKRFSKVRQFWSTMEGNNLK